MIKVTQENMKELAFEDDLDDEILPDTPENEAERLIEYYEQKYGFKKIAG